MGGYGPPIEWQGPSDHTVLTPQISTLNTDYQTPLFRVKFYVGLLTDPGASVVQRNGMLSVGVASYRTCLLPQQRRVYSRPAMAT